MAFKLGDIIVDRLQFGYGAKSNGTPLYALTELNEASVNVTANSVDINDAQGNLVYRKYTGKQGEVNATNAFVNLAVISTLAATDAEIATADHGVVMPIITTVDAGKTLDITNYVAGSVVVNALNKVGSIGDEFKLGSSASATEFAITDVAADPSNNIEASSTLTPPTAEGEIQYIVKYKKTVYSGAKVTVGDKFPTAHELFFKALVVDKCDRESLRAAILHIPSFVPSPEFTVALQGGDNQTMDFNGTILLNACSTDKELFSLYYIDEIEED